MSAHTLSSTLIDRLVPDSGVSMPESIDAPERELPAGAEITRFAPSPTGYVHIGGILVALVSKSMAETTGGVFILRVEDTDQQRFVEGAEAQLLRALDYFGLTPDESPREGGDYGPYRQSERGPIYDIYVRDLLRRGLAYPCFCTAEMLAAATAEQRAAGVPSGYWGPWANCRSLDAAAVTARLHAGAGHVVRFRAPEFEGRRVVFSDRVRGRLEIEDNRNDVVVRKTAGLPTYHLAHVIDDHLMGTTTVVRADEWISSVPLHLQLFAAFGFDPPAYGHIAPIWIQDGKSKRKLSKRKDPQANVDFYLAQGYPAEAVLTYLRGIANARLQDQPPADVLRAQLRIEECSVSGQVLDLSKLSSISRDLIAEMPVSTAADTLTSWATRYDPALAQAVTGDRLVLERALSLEGSSPGTLRKDLAHWSEFRAKYGFLIPAVFDIVTSPTDIRFKPLLAEDVLEISRSVLRNYRHDLAGDEWFGQVRAAAVNCGFAATPADFKRDPAAYRGQLRDAANVVRVLLTGTTRSPDLFQVTRLLGETEVRRRLASLVG